MELLAIAGIAALIVWLVVRGRRSRPAYDLEDRPATIHQPSRSIFHMEGDGDFEFDVVGEASYQDALDRITGGKTDAGHEHECLATLIREPHNPHDSNAIAVFIEGRKVGYIARREASAISEMMDRNGFDRFTADAMIVGGWDRGSRGQAHYGVKLDLPT